MKKSLTKLMNLFPAIRSADHLSHEWDAEDYRLNEEDVNPGMNRYPALLVDSSASVTLAEWNWVAMPSWTQGGNHAYMLSNASHLIYCNHQQEQERLTMLNKSKIGAADKGTTRLILILGILIVAALAVYMLSGMPDRRSTGERVGDAIDGLPHGVGEAGSRLGDQTPAQKLGDKIEDTTK